MSDPVIHTIPSEVSISADIQNLFDDTKAFVHRNRDLCIIIGVIGITVVLNRSMLRRELRRLQFTAEFFPYDSIDYDALEEMAGNLER